MAVIVTHVAFFMYLMQGVLCNQWNLVLPGSIRAIRESCVTVPCRFQYPSSFDGRIQPNCSAIWLKGSTIGSVVFNSTKPEIRNGIKGEFTGDLRMKNCTTVFHNFPENHNDTYFFRLECPSGDMKYTFGTGVYISSHADPPPPELTTSPRRDLVDGESVRLQCKAPVPCHGQVPAISWMPPMEGMNVGEGRMDTAADGQITLTSTLTFKATPSYHDSTITCSVRYPLDQGFSSVQTQALTVQFAPQFTTATQTPPGPIRIGQAVTLTCSSEANPPVERYSWFIDDRGQLRRTAEGERLLLLASLEASQVYVCEARNNRGSHRSRPIALELDLTPDSGECFSIVPYILCGVLLVLYTLTVVVAMGKCHRLSRRLKHLELKGKEEHTYSALRASSVAPDYDTIQRQAAPQTEGPCYENPITTLGLSDRP